ncbi:putative reverse transcriptase domain-containing protein [Tanacetum coccineum]
MERLMRLYKKEVVSKLRVPVSILSDRDSRFTSRFWQSLQKALGARPDTSIAYQPQIDDQSEKTIQTLKEHATRLCDRFWKWLEWTFTFSRVFSKVRDSQLIGPEIIHESTKKIIQIKNWIQAARDRQKSYADVRRKPLEFQVGVKVMLKVSPWKGDIRFNKQGKQNLQYIGPFKVLARVETVAYRRGLPQQPSKVHSTFHVSNLKKCLFDETLVILLDKIQIDDKLYFIEEPVEIMD